MDFDTMNTNGDGSPDQLIGALENALQDISGQISSLESLVNGAALELSTDGIWVPDGSMDSTGKLFAPRGKRQGRAPAAQNVDSMKNDINKLKAQYAQIQGILNNAKKRGTLAGVGEIKDRGLLTVQSMTTNLIVSNASTPFGVQATDNGMVLSVSLQIGLHGGMVTDLRYKQNNGMIGGNLSAAGIGTAGSFLLPEFGRLSLPWGRPIDTNLAVTGAVTCDNAAAAPNATRLSISLWMLKYGLTR